MTQNTARLTTQCLKEKKVNVLAWPSQSQDLNTIENLWNYLKIAVHQRLSSSLTELKQVCKEEWADIHKVLTHLIDSVIIV